MRRWWQRLNATTRMASLRNDAACFKILWALHVCTDECVLSCTIPYIPSLFPVATDNYLSLLPFICLAVCVPLRNGASPARQAVASHPYRPLYEHATANHHLWLCHDNAQPHKRIYESIKHLSSRIKILFRSVTERTTRGRRRKS